MAILLAGTSAAELLSGAAGYFNSAVVSTFVVEGAQIQSSTFADTPIFEPVSEGGFCFYVYPSTGVVSTNAICSLISANTQVFRFLAGGAVQYWNGTAWVALSGATMPAHAAGNSNRYDLLFKIHATEGYIRIYKDRVSVYEFTGNTQFNGITSVSQVRLHRMFSNNSQWTTYSAWIMASEDTRPLEYTQLLPAATGSTNEWDGNRSSAAGSIGFSDATFMSTTVADEVVTFDLANVISAARTGYTVDCLVASARVRTDGGNAGEVRLAAKSGASFTYGSDVVLTSSTLPTQIFVPVDPATGVAWTISGLDSAEVGVQSRTP